MGDVDPPPRPKLGAYGLGANRGRHTHGFQLANPVAFETLIGQIAKPLADHNKGGFTGNNKDNPKNETCNAIELRSKKV